MISDKIIFSSTLKDEQGDVNVDGSDDEKISTASTWSNVQSLPRNKDVVKFSSFTTVDTPDESHQVSAGLHEKERDGNEVDSMYDEEQVAAPDDGTDNPIDAPLSKAKVCIDLYYTFAAMPCSTFLFTAYSPHIINAIRCELAGHDREMGT